MSQSASPSSRPGLPPNAAILAAVFGAVGVAHLTKPEAFEPLMPEWVPARREVIFWSGVADLACAAGLLAPRTRRPAGWASVLVLLAVYPANLKQARDARAWRRTLPKAAAYARLPLQWPMIQMAVRVAREA